ncbi:MAG: 3'-5' exonuclease [Prolixibacteraceae bacterium]|nr:3'-5' exonuclease [Prolixibacteraceae bacterium]
MHHVFLLFSHRNKYNTLVVNHSTFVGIGSIIIHYFGSVYAVIDIETTGGSLQTGKITEIAIYLFNGESITDSFVSLINPECNIPAFITNLTGISNEMVANAPKFYEIARKIVEITANQIFVAHNASFDYQFIRKEFKDLGFDFKRKTLCTVQMSRRYLPNHRSYSLGKLCADLGIEINGRHRAAGDALATVSLLKRILDQHQASTRSLFQE